MSDPRIENAKQALAEGAFEQVIQILKPLLGEMPDNMEIRSILTEAQEGMMLRLQLSQKVNKAAELLKGNDTESAKKTISEVLKLDPTNPEALGMQRTFFVPPAEDLSSTVDFGITDQAFEDAISAPIEQSREPGGLDGLEDFSLPLDGFQQEAQESPMESTKNSGRAKAPSEEFPPMEDFGASLPTDDLSIQAGPAMEDFGGVPQAEQFPLKPNQAEATVLSSDSVMPFSLPGEGGKVEAFISEGKSLIASGKYQEAIDVLTRIFILDEENQEAQRLIDQAKELEVNREREINLILNEAISAYDSKSYEKAKSLFRQVLSTFPGHREADFYLKEIEARDGSGAAEFQLETPAASAFELEGAAGEFSFDASAGASSDDLASLVGQPAPQAPPPPPPVFGDDTVPQPVMAPPGPFKAQPSALKPKKKSGSRAPIGLIVLIIGALAVVSALVFVGPMVWGKLFSPKPKAMSIPPTKPEKPVNSGQQKPVIPVTPPAPQKSLSELVAEAKAAVQEKQFEKAVALYVEAEKIDKNDLDIKMSLQAARDALAKQQEEAAKNQKFVTDFEKASQYFKLQEYGEALRISWRLIYPDDTLAKQMGKADTIRKIIKNGYYNWGVKELKAANPAAAKKNFQDLVDFSPDPKGRELLDFSKRYTNASVDDAYRSYVQELSFRSLED